MAQRPKEQPVAGYFDGEAASGQAARAADEIRAEGGNAAVRGGTEVAEGRFGGQLFRGLLIGVLIAVPFALVVPLLAWARQSTGVSPLFVIGWLGPPILFVGAFLGLVVQASRHEMSKRARAKLVVTEPGLSQSQADRATTTITELGGEVVRSSQLDRNRAAD